jgi:hypothetical protein
MLMMLMFAAGFATAMLLIIGIRWLILSAAVERVSPPLWAR